MTVSNAFLRSINIQLDIGHYDRIEHFRPTSKSVRLVTSLLGDTAGKALFVVAPYGSGKSITAAYLGTIVENQPSAAPLLKLLDSRIKLVDPDLGALTARRRQRKQRGLFVPLYGHVPSAPRALKETVLAAMRRNGLGREARTLEKLPATTSTDLVDFLATCSSKLESAGRDRLVVVWDEFGRHLQGLISEGRPEDLDVVQVLAETVARASGVTASLVLLLHRSLLGYAKGLPTGVRREWAKIEGRFETLQYLNDSNELYELIGSLVEEGRAVDSGDVMLQLLLIAPNTLACFQKFHATG